MRHSRIALFCLTLLSTAALHAQSFEDVTFLRTNEPSLSVRGAGMGAVSIDDAAKNPASLGALERAFFSLGGTRTDYQILEIDRATPLPTSHPRALSKTAFSRAAFAIPVGDFVFGAHYVADPELRGTRPFSPGGHAPSKVFDPATCGAGCGVTWGTPMPTFERRDERYGISAAYKLGNLSLGAGVEMQQLHELASIERALATRETLVPLDIVVFGVSSRDFVPNAGVRWVVTPRIALAAAYQGGGSFRYRVSSCQVDANPSVCSTPYLEVPILDANSQISRTASSYRASASFAVTDEFTLAAEAVRRNYSDVHVAYADADEYHAGAEYRLTENLILRAGWWRDPTRFNTSFVSPLWPNAQAHDHVTFGTGVDLGGARVDFAYDHADEPALRQASFGITFGGNGR